MGRERQFEPGALVRRRLQLGLGKAGLGVVIGPTDRERQIWAPAGAVDVLFEGRVVSYHPGNLVPVDGDGDISTSAV